MNPHNTHLGVLIVIEGIDGAGTTTQTDLLVAWLTRIGIPSLATREPSDGPIGVVARKHLGRHLDLASPEAEALAFAADRMDHVASEIVPALERGITVVADRYYLSSLAYQSLSCDMEWVREINRYALQPDLTVLLSVSVDVGVGRFSGRARLERFEDDPDELARIVARYEAAVTALRADGEAITVIDGARSTAEVHADVVRLAAGVLAPRHPGADLTAGRPPA